MSESFAGISEFVWFIGVVEDRMDPEYAGRLRVRCLAHHTSDKNAIATSDLMWASVVYTDGGISGLGNSPALYVEGTHVMGYFRDGLERQEPVVLGTLPWAPVEYSQSGGFYDPNGTYPKFEEIFSFLAFHEFGVFFLTFCTFVCLPHLSMEA